MKRFLLKILPLVFSLCGVGVDAHDFKVDGIYYNILSETELTVEVTSGSYSYGYEGVVSIPDSVTHEGVTYRVTRIGNYAFDGCDKLTEVAIPKGVTSIGVCAFSHCSALSDIALPEGVATIHAYAFRYCTGLTRVVVPNSVTSMGEEAFRGCTGVAEVTLSERLTTISAGAFEGCTGITAFVIPGGVDSIAEEALKNCTGLTEITIPSYVRSIDNYVFRGCTGITEVTIADGATPLELGYNVGAYNGEGLFYDCPLTTLYVGRDLSYSSSYCAPFGGIATLQRVTIGDDVTTIGAQLFEDCCAMTDIVIGSGVTTIDNEAFRGCAGLTRIDIPDAVSQVGYRAFADCEGVTEVTIGLGVTYIGEEAFSDCSALTTLHYNAVACDMLGSLFTPAFAGTTSLDTLHIGERVESIPSGAFGDCYYLTEITSLATVPPVIESTTFDSYTATLYVPCESVEAYQSAPYWKKFTIKSLNDINAIEENVLPAADIAVAGGRLIITGVADNVAVHIYALNGALMLTTTVAQAGNIHLPQGLYLVRVGNTVKRVVV